MKNLTRKDEPLTAETRKARFPASLFERFSVSPRSTPKRRPYGGVALTTIGAAGLAYIALLDYFKPDNVHLPAVSYLGLITLAFIAGIVTNLPAIISAHSSSAERTQHELLKEQLAPTLYAGMEELVDRWSEYLLPGAQLHDENIQIDERLQIELHVFLRINGHYRIVASSTGPHASVRHLKLSDNEGLVHLVYKRKTAVLARIEPDFNAKLLTRHGREFSDQPPLLDANAEKCNPALNWIYATPIRNNLKHQPWSDDTLGVLTVDGLHSSSGDLFLRDAFCDLVEGLALQLAPYVYACAALGVVPHTPSD